jgi:hypothetical protein
MRQFCNERLCARGHRCTLDASSSPSCLHAAVSVQSASPRPCALGRYIVYPGYRWKHEGQRSGQSLTSDGALCFDTSANRWHLLPGVPCPLDVDNFTEMSSAAVLSGRYMYFIYLPARSLGDAAQRFVLHFGDCAREQRCLSSAGPVSQLVDECGANRHFSSIIRLRGSGVPRIFVQPLKRA